MKAQRSLLPLVALLAITATAACSSPEPGGGEHAETAVPHGYVEGAEEAGEAQTRLTYLDSATGAIHVIDLATGEEIHQDTVQGAASLLDDGRFVFVPSPSGSGPAVLDTGVWTVDHGDHKHYYKKAPATLDAPLREPSGSASGDGHHVALFDSAAGVANIVGREGLEAGETTTALSIESTPHQGIAVPYKEHYLLSSHPDERGLPVGVDLHDADGNKIETLHDDCPGLTGQATTRYGVLFGCKDGTVLVSQEGNSFTAQKIDYPSAEGAQPGKVFNHRPGSNEVAATAGTKGAWHIDASTRKARLLMAPEAIITATAAGDESTVLAIGESGTLYRLDAATGKVTDKRKLLKNADGANPPSLEVDTTRAYINDAAGHKIHEIDYLDHLRTARTFQTSGTADIIVETGL